MRPAPAPLAPMFRSEAQLAILGEVFCGVRPYTISELAAAAGTTVATASREVTILSECGVVAVGAGPGNSKLVSPADDLAYGEDLRRILTHTYGLLPRLRAMLANEDRVEQAWIFGSWARRYRGERGHFPRDIDIVIVTETSGFELLLAWHEIERDLRVEINPVQRRPGDFSVDDALWADTDMVRVK